MDMDSYVVSRVRIKMTSIRMNDTRSIWYRIVNM